MKKFFSVLLLAVILLVGFSFPISAQAADPDCENVDVHFFWAEGCPHCAKEKNFLDKLEKKYPEIEIRRFEVGNNRENQQHMQQLANKLGVQVRGVPFTVVGDQHFVGYHNDQTTGEAIEKAVQCILPENSGKKKEVMPESINVPLLGSLKTENFSLPLFSIVLGFLDGFNPCAMWTLLFLISLLLNIEEKGKRWILGVVFIVASAFVYFLFMAAWLNFFLFVGYATWMRYLIGGFAAGLGIYNLYQFATNPEGGCKVTGSKKRRKVFENIKKIVRDKRFIFSIAGIILLAFAVNLVELVCSAGLPAIFTRVLTLSDLPLWQYYAYLLLYIFFFMIDDLIIFFTAMITLHATGIEGKYARFSNLIGGIIIFLLGFLLIFKPGVLMFGG